MEMEYEFYAEQKYTPAGAVEARVLTAAEAAALHYEAGRVVKKKAKGHFYYFRTTFQRKVTPGYAGICEKLSHTANGGNA